MKSVVAGHSRTIAYTSSALDVYLERIEKQNYSFGILYLTLIEEVEKSLLGTTKLPLKEKRQ